MPAESGDVVAAVSSAAAEVASGSAEAEVASGSTAAAAAAVSSGAGNGGVGAAAAAVAVTSTAVAVASGGFSSDQIVRRIISRVPGAGNEFLHSIWILGNHHYFRLIWSVVGMICGTLAPLYLVMSGHGLTRVHAQSDRGECYCFIQHVQHVAASARGAGDLMVVGCILTGLTYWVSYYCRDIDFFRAVHRPWYFAPIGNASVFIVSYYITVAHRNTESAIIAFLLLAVVALAFIEIVRPVMDYGFLQTFLKMPLVIAFLYYDGLHLAAWELYIPCVVLVIYGTFVMPWFHSDRPSRVRARETRGPISQPQPARARARVPRSRDSLSSTHESE